MMREETNLSTGTIFKILHEGLQLRRVASRFVPHLLSEKNKQDRVDICRINLKKFRDGKSLLSDILTCDETWIYHRQLGSKATNSQWKRKDDHPHTIAKNRFSKKNLFTFFFNSSGIVHVNMLEKGTTMTNESYIECLENAFNSILEKRRIRGLKLLHDNARPHKHSNVQIFLSQHSVTEVPHPPYSPDLSPCDFWLNSYVKRNLPYCTNEDELLDTVLNICLDIPVKEYRKTFSKWIERMGLCIENIGDYFEHLINEL